MLISNLKVGDKISNQQLCKIFICGSQGGMRRSLTTNSLVLISNYIKSIYNDHWDNNIFYYTGMGQEGDQSLEFSQNKTLAQSQSNNVDLYLFEVFKRNEYCYIDQVFLSGKPYIENQLDINFSNRKVYIFPLKCASDFCNVYRDDINYMQEKRLKTIKKISDDQLKKIVYSVEFKPSQRQSISKIYDRNIYLSEFVKRLARGICQLCLQKAPFDTLEKEPYLETHHIKWLSQGGFDSLENIVALCPNCHRKMHIINSKRDISFLEGRVKARLKS